MRFTFTSVPDTLLLPLLLRQIGVSKVHSLDYSNFHIDLILPKALQRLQNNLPGGQYINYACQSFFHQILKPIFDDQYRGTERAVHTVQSK